MEMYKLEKSKKTCIIFLILFLGNLPIVSVVDASKNSGTTYLSFAEYLYFWEECKEGDTIEWEFQGSNSYVGIDVIAMTQNNFDKFELLMQFFYYELSNGQYYSDYGTFEVKSDDVWYIVFVNLDEDFMSTNLTYEVNFKHGGPIGLIIGIIVGVIVVISVIGAIVIKTKKQKEVVPIPVMDPSSPDTMFQTQPTLSEINIYAKQKFCTNCGQSADPDAKYCINCGAAFR